jgi:aldose 1-epimerase
MTLSTLELHLAEWRLRIAPALGGCVMGFWMGETPILRPAPRDIARAGQSAAYPLVPFSNRIGQGQMTWQGRSYRLRNGFNAEPHALHGVGFMSAWSVIEQGAASALLRMTHSPDEHWPFAFEAEQRFELVPDGLCHTISARSTDTRLQPMGLGWHPFFVRRPGSMLDVQVQTQWLSSEDKLPTAPRPVNGLHGPVAEMRLDHCFEGAGAVATLDDGALHITLASDSRYWVVYTPEQAGDFCVEPVTHLNNAVQQPDPLAHGLVALAEGGSLRQEVHVRCRRAVQSPGGTAQVAF